MDLQPDQKLGRYTVLRKIAEGGMAEIYLAQRDGASGFQKFCVIKRVRAQYRLDERFRTMFEEEARLAANLDDPNIVQVYDFQHEDGELFLAMQYVDGCSLEHLRQRLVDTVMPPFLAARIARDVANALNYAHDFKTPAGEPLNLVHRDVSPHNVLISRTGKVLLTDFGIAKPVSKATSGGFKGKLAYMAPEQARMGLTDGRTDIFALGVVLYELVTGKRPFNGDSFVEIIEEIGRGTAPAPRASAQGVDVPEALADIIAKALERSPDARYARASDMARALDGFLRQAPSDVDLDLGRFVLERIGAPSLNPYDASAVPAGAIEDTRVSIDGLLPSPTVLVASDAAKPTAEEVGPTLITLPRVPSAPPPKAAPPESTAPGVPPAPVPLRLSMPALPRAIDADPTVHDLHEELAQPRRSRPWGLLVGAGLAVLGAAAFLTLRASQHASPPLPDAAERKPSAPAVIAAVAHEAPPAKAPPPAPPKTEQGVYAGLLPAVAAAPPPQVAVRPVDAGAGAPAPRPSATAPLALASATESPARPTPAVNKTPALHPSRGPQASPAPHEPGYLRVTAAPYAQVYEGHTRLCDDAPCNVTVSAGTHRLRFQSGDRVLTQSVRVDASAHVCVNADFTGKAPVTAPCTWQP